MGNNLKMLEAIERIRQAEKERCQAICSKDATVQADISQKKIENGRRGNFSNRCKICDDTTWILRSVDGRNLGSRCECFNEKMKDKSWIFKSSGIPAEYSKRNFSQFKPCSDKSSEMKAIAINYYKNFDTIKKVQQNSIMFCGNPGSGKTHLSMAIANNLMDIKKVKVSYMAYRDVITYIKQNMLDSDIYRSTVDKFKNVAVLIIDDLFKGTPSQSDINVMFEIINYRYFNNLPMIISTEYTIAQLNMIDEAIASRIYEMAKNYTVEIKGIENNYRYKQVK